MPITLVPKETSQWIVYNAYLDGEMRNNLFNYTNEPLIYLEHYDSQNDPDKYIQVMFWYGSYENQNVETNEETLCLH